MFSVKGQAFELTRGDTAAISVNFSVEGDRSLDGARLDFSVREGPWSPLVIHKTIDDLSDPIIILEPRDTRALQCMLYVYDLQLTLASGEVYTLLGLRDDSGPTTFHILPEVTYE